MRIPTANHHRWQCPHIQIQVTTTTKKRHNTWSWNPHSTWLYIASPCTGTGASRLCRQDERLSGKHEDKIIFNALFDLSPSAITHSTNSYEPLTSGVSGILWKAPLNQDKTSNLQRRPHITLLPELWWAVKATQKKGLGPLGLSIHSGFRCWPQAVCLREHHGNHMPYCTALSGISVLIQIQVRSSLF